MAQPPDSNGSNNNSQKAYETNSSKDGHDKRLPRDRPYVPIAKPVPPEENKPSRAAQDSSNPSIQNLPSEDIPKLDAERARKARDSAKRFYLILLAFGLTLGAVLSVAIVMLLNRFGLTDPPERPLLEQIQPEPSSSDSSVDPDSNGLAMSNSLPHPRMV